MEEVIKIKTTLSHDDELMKQAKLRPQIQSINKLNGTNDGRLCNYCHQGKSYSWGLVNEQYSPYTYEIMMERGWRRCGTYYYKLDLQKSCCKQWTHRLDTNSFRIKKDQKKTVKKMIQICYEPIYKLESDVLTKQQELKKPRKRFSNNNINTSLLDSKPSEKQSLDKQKQPNVKIIIQVPSKYKSLLFQICQQINKMLRDNLSKLIPENKLNKQTIKESWNFNFLDKLRYFVSKPEQKTDYYCNYIMLLYGCNKKKFNIKQYPLLEFVKDIKQYIQIQLKLQKIGQNQFFLNVQRGGYLLLQLSKKLKQQKSEQFQVIQQVHLDPIPDSSTPIQQHSLKAQFEVSQKMPAEGQVKAFNKKFSSMKFEKLEPFEFKGQLNITTDTIKFGKLQVYLVPAQENPDSFKLYQSYTKDIHQQADKTLSSYTNFLCQQGLIYQNIERQAPNDAYYQPSFDPTQKYQQKQQIKGKISKKLGCYHMKYFLDSKLIGVGVVDILPHGLSSVYFFYDPEYKDKRLGIFSSIIEIQYIKYLSITFPEFKYYYMGFYIHDNEKMSYKGDYGPYQLLCPITYNFVPVDDRVKQLINKIVQDDYQNIRLASEQVQKHPDMTFTTDLGVYIDKNIKLMYKNKQLTLKQINSQFFIPVLQLLKTYLAIWGKQTFQIFTFTF